MSLRPRFGPAGVPPKFREMKVSTADVPRLLREEGLDAFEYEAARWGRKPQIRREEAEKLGSAAELNDVWLSMHGSYFINFCGKQPIVEESKQRLVACATGAEWMGAHVVVFHAGVYGLLPHEVALKMCSSAMRDVAETLSGIGVKKVKIGPETMGKMQQFGTLDEIIALCKSVERTQLVIDWSHLHARGLGRLRKVDDVRKVITEVENNLGTEATKTMHCHFSKIEYTDKGERRHHSLEEPRFGPDFRLFAKVIVEFDLNPTIICESPVLDIDALKMRDILREERDKAR